MCLFILVLDSPPLIFILSPIFMLPFHLQLPIYSVVTLGCYGLLMVGVGLMQFPTCPQEALLLQQVCYFSLPLYIGISYWLSSEKGLSYIDAITL